LAGLRTNTLVALGAASFIVLEALAPRNRAGSGSLHRRYPVSACSGGRDFSGRLERPRSQYRGDLWCSAAIGVLAGGGYAAYAAMATAFFVFVILLLRPIVSFIKRQPLVSTELEIGCVV
jgi:putative Mg2+ transporter-C (MgtC) family protein